MTVAGPAKLVARLLALVVLILLVTTKYNVLADAADHPERELWTQLVKINQGATSIKSLSGRFVQVRHTPLLREPLESTGDVIAYDGKILWTTRQPRPSVVLVTQEQIEIFHPEERLLEIFPIDKKIAQFAASPVQDLDALKRHFLFERIGPDDLADHDLREHVADGTLVPVRLVPRETSLAERLESIDIFLERHGYLRRMEMSTVDGEKTVLTLHSVQMNRPLDLQPLQIDLPPDVSISRPGETHGTLDD